MKLKFWKRKGEKKRDENNLSRGRESGAVTSKDSDAAGKPPERVAKPLKEVRIVQIAYGVAKVEEAGGNQSLRAAELPEDSNIVPYHEKGVIQGVYVIELNRKREFNGREFLYPILESIPYFLVDDEARRNLKDRLQKLGVSLLEPAEQDLTLSFKKNLQTSKITWRNEGAKDFSLSEFVGDILSVKSSPQFQNLYLIKTAKKRRYVLAVDRLIESVIDLHPQFIKVYQPEAVRLTFQQSENTWLAPLRPSILQ